MTRLSRQTLFWLPRALSIAFIAFLSLFALDVFTEQDGLWNVLAALAVHLIPSFLLIVALLLAWRWEWVGTLLYGAAGAAYLGWFLPRSSFPAATKLLLGATIAGPAFAVAVLFWVNWLKRGELRSREKIARSLS